jgi:hypothetical protein
MSYMTLTATIFPTTSAEGVELLEAVLPITQALGVDTKVIRNPTQTQMTHACAKDDVVLIDATVEPDGSHNYAAMTAQPTAMDHVLVMSRTYLPLNFYGLREGGAPSYPLRFTNSQIVSWLEGELEDLLSSQPRQWWKKSLLGSISTSWSDVNKAAARAQDRYQVFISFRNNDFAKVNKFKERLESGEFHDGRPQGVRLFEPGALTFQDEVLSAFQRWHVVSIVEERLRTCREMWVYEGSQFYNSWWTRGEIVLLAYYQALNGHHPTLQIFKPDQNGQVISEPRGLVPEISHEQKRAMDRLFSNTGRHAGAETARSTRELAELPILRNYKFFNDEVFSLSFLRVPLLEEQVSAAKSKIDVDEFLAMNEPPLRPVPKHILDEAERSGRAVDGDYEIRVEPNPRFIWYATRMGKLNGPEDTGELTIARQSVYRASRMN